MVQRISLLLTILALCNLSFWAQNDSDSFYENAFQNVSIIEKHYVAEISWTINCEWKPQLEANNTTLNQRYITKDDYKREKKKIESY